jgi:uncharacterized membrane protein
MPGGIDVVFLVSGLLLFLGAHSVRILADDWRASLIAARGAGAWRGLYALVSLTGFALIIYGYGQARGGAPVLPNLAGLRDAAMVLVTLGFICLVAAYWPRNHIKALLGDPMVFGVGLWALGHLLVKTTPSALVLFAAFLAWAVADYVSLRTRAKAASASAAGAPPTVGNTVFVVIVGSVVSAAFVLLLHRLLIGVAPLG